MEVIFIETCILIQVFALTFLVCITLTIRFHEFLLVYL